MCISKRKIFMTFSRKKIIKIAALVVIVLLCFVFGWYAVSRILSVKHRIKSYSLKHEAAGKKTISARTLKIGAYNIAHGRGGKRGDTNWKHETREELIKHLDRISEQILKEPPDILVLNEVDFSSAWSFHLNQAGYIAGRCGYTYVLEQRNIDVSFPFYKFIFGNAVLSRYPLKNEMFVKFPPKSKIENLFVGNHDGLYCEVDLPGGGLGIFAIHLEARSEDVRVSCAKLIAEKCSSVAKPVIAVGDFNSTPKGFPEVKLSENGENAMSFLLDKGGFIPYLELKNDPDYYTFPSEAPVKVIDWIIGKGINGFLNSERVKSPLSDHLMIVTNVRV